MKVAKYCSVERTTLQLIHKEIHAVAWLHYKYDRIQCDSEQSGTPNCRRLVLKHKNTSSYYREAPNSMDSIYTRCLWRQSYAHLSWTGQWQHILPLSFCPINQSFCFCLSLCGTLFTSICFQGFFFVCTSNVHLADIILTILLFYWPGYAIHLTGIQPPTPQDTHYFYDIISVQLKIFI